MPILNFLCPTTREYFDSGVRLDERSAAASRLNIVRVGCPHCRREHRFLLADGILDSHPPEDADSAEMLEDQERSIDPRQLRRQLPLAGRVRDSASGQTQKYAARR